MLCLLLLVYALGFRKAFPPKSQWPELAFWMIVIYALSILCHVMKKTNSPAWVQADE